MEAAGRKERGRWSTAVALGAAMLFLPALESFPLVALALSVLMLALPPYSIRAVVLAIGIAVWVFLLFPVQGAWSLVSCGWALLAGGLFALMTVARPQWGFTARALAAITAASLGVGVWLGLTGAWSPVDWLAGEHYRSAALLMAGTLVTQLPEAAWVPGFTAAVVRSASWFHEVFPALVALQTFLALGLAWWAFIRASASEGAYRALRPLRDFRFNDQLVWLAIAGLVLVVFPFGSPGTRAGANLLMFMGCLYAVRGIAVFVFLAARVPSRMPVVLGALAVLFFSQIVLTAAVLVGLGDTWLDVRGRAAAAAA